jgi:hypothetical protein
MMNCFAERGPRAETGEGLERHAIYLDRDVASRPRNADYTVIGRRCLRPRRSANPLGI